MRRHVLLIGMLIGQLTWTTAFVSGQETPVPANPTAHTDSDENYKALTARIEDLAAANEAMQKNLNKLRDEVQKLADEVGRATDHSKDSATTESLKQLKAAIEEVDKKRIEDQKLVLAQLETLKKILDKPITLRPNPNPAPGNGNPSTQLKKPAGASPSRPETAAHTQPENGYNYTIQDGDYLAAIVAKLKKQGMKVTMKQVMDANPGVNWTKLKINQVIFIPAVTQP